MKQQLPTSKGFALCERCFYGPLRNELKKHKAYIRKTYSGNLGTWSRDQVRFLAQSLGIDLEKYKKDHKSHVPFDGEPKPTDVQDSDLDNLDLPYMHEVPDKFKTFGERFLTLMEKRPDINKCIQEVLRSKLGTPGTQIPTRQFNTSNININAPNLSIPTVNQPKVYQPASLPPAHINSVHNFGYTFVPPSTSLASPPTMQIFCHPAYSNNININFNLHLSNNTTNTNFDVPPFFSDINNAISTSLQHHATLIHNMQFSNVQFQFLQTSKDNGSNV